MADWRDALDAADPAADAASFAALFRALYRRTAPEPSPDNEGPTMTEPTTHACESCGMPNETGRYCTYCTTDSGELQPFDERFARMVAWQQRRHPEQDPADAEAATLAYLATMPAWRDHPRVVGQG